jgi:AcrR family transcriptional regulator
MNPAKKRARARRMPPEARARAILEAAAALILENGSASVGMDQVAERAGISKPLIYKYFPGREELLKAILAREFEALRGRGLDSIPNEVPVEQVIRGTVERALRYYDERGPILRLLATDPDVARLTREGGRSSRSTTTDWFAKRPAQHYGVPRDVAMVAVTLVVNAPIHSMGWLRQQGSTSNATSMSGPSSSSAASRPCSTGSPGTDNGRSRSGTTSRPTR